MKNEKSNKPPIFIGGCPRSGTTLLRLILDSHSNVAITPESGYLFEYQKILPLYKNLLEKRNRKNLITDLLKIRRVGEWFSNLEKIPDRSENAENYVLKKIHTKVTKSIKDLNISAKVSKEGTPQRSIRFNRAFKIGFNKTAQKTLNYKVFSLTLKALFETYAELNKKNRWGDKTPKNAVRIDAIKGNFSNAKFIIVVRDGRDTALSLKKAKFGEISITSAAYEWRKYIKTVNQYLAKYEKDILKVKYENLLRTPEKELKRISKFIDEPYEEDILDKYLRHKDDVTHTKSRYYQKKLNPKNINKWEKIMTPDEIAKFEQIAGKELQQERYKLSNQKVDNNYPHSILKAATTVDKIRRLFNPDYNQNYLNFVKILFERVITPTPA